MRRCTSSTRPLARRTTMYLPRRSMLSTRSPVRIDATTAGSSGRVRRESAISTDASVRPSSFPARRRRSVSTSGSSGNDFEQDGALRWGLVADLVRSGNGAHRLVGRRLVARVNLREHVAGGDLLPALAPADDTDRVVDLVVLRSATRPEVERRDADGNRAQRDDCPGAWRGDLTHERR